jgi:hypothetical protein
MFRGFLFAVAAVSTLPMLATAQQPGPAAVALTLHPQGEATRALKHQLAPEVRDLTRGNAATHYYQAFLFMGKGIPAEQATQFYRWASTSIKELPKTEVRTQLNSYRAVLEEIELGSNCDHCNWEMTERLRRHGIGTLLPEAQRMRELGTLLRLRAHLEIAEGKFDEAVTSIRTGLAIARHTAQGPTLINALVGIAIASVMLEQAEFLVSEPGAPNLYWAVTALPSPFIDIQRATQGERLWVEHLFPHARGPRRYSPLSGSEVQKLQDNFLSLIAEIGEGGGKGDWKTRLAFAALAAKMYPEARKRLLTGGAKAADVDAMPIVQVALLDSIDEYERGMDEFLKWTNLPYWQAREGVLAAETGLQAKRGKGIGSHSLAAILLPGMGKIHQAQARLERRLTALRTVEAIRLHAAANANKFPETLDVIKVPLPLDPVTGKRFEFKRQGDKAELIGLPPGKEIAGPHNSLRYDLRFVVKE